VHSGYLNLKFECWRPLSLPSVPVFAMSLGMSLGHSQLPDDDSMPGMTHPRLSASSLKEVKQRFASYPFNQGNRSCWKANHCEKNTEIYCVPPIVYYLTQLQHFLLFGH